MVKIYSGEIWLCGSTSSFYGDQYEVLFEIFAENSVDAADNSLMITREFAEMLMP